MTARSARRRCSATDLTQIKDGCLASLKIRVSSVFNLWPRTSPLDTQQAAGFGVAGGGLAELAGGDAGQRQKLPPAEGRTGGGELFGHRAIILLGVQGPVFADGVLQHEIE